MINNLNTLDLLKPKLITMDKYSGNTMSPTRILPMVSVVTTATTTTASALGTQSARTGYITYNSRLIENRLEPQNQECRERVKVQHLQNHAKLQNNNCWNNFCTLYNLSASNNNSRCDDDQQQEEVTGEEFVSNTLQQQHNAKQNIFKNSLNEIQKKSAFNLIYNNINNIVYNNLNSTTPAAAAAAVTIKELNNNVYIQRNSFKKQPTSAVVSEMIPETGMMRPSSLPIQQQKQRTEDQDHAYRHIESVHNYAKSSPDDDEDDIDSPNGSGHSSYEEESVEEDEDDDDDENEIGEIKRSSAMADLDEDYEDIFNRRRLKKLSTCSDGALFIRGNRAGGVVAGRLGAKNLENNLQKIHYSNAETDLHIDVDVETVDIPANQNSAMVLQNANNDSDNSPVPSPSSSSFTLSPTSGVGVGDNGCTESTIKPDHHARRPMNAFLIFCKRHRAIVKERYKNLENRAITKILGDWWASLETSDKKCFTNLAQMNKDAFFSANPNFKWYKLPAPPLRTLNTRPSNTTLTSYSPFTGAMVVAGGDYDENLQNDVLSDAMLPNHITSSHGGNYFKLADEAQMGDLSQLMEDKLRNKQASALQQVLGETSHFISTQIASCGGGGGGGNGAEINSSEHKSLKRRLYSEKSSSNSSNSSEDAADAPTMTADDSTPKKKTARSCKGKIYQELVQSGQIAPLVKKSKSSSRLNAAVMVDGGGAAVTDAADNNTPQTNLAARQAKLLNGHRIGAAAAAAKLANQKRSFSESTANILMSPSFESAEFDLEDKIKELPALSLDDYLQRKRNTKKKKKLSTGSKKRASKSSASSTNKPQKSNLVNNTVKNASQSNVNAEATSLDNQNCAKRTEAQSLTAINNYAAAAAVGSQKRKARKESITRRDVRAIEEEVASLLPLTINGCCYFQEASSLAMPATYQQQQQEMYNNGNDNNNASPRIANTSLIIPSSLSASPQQQQQQHCTNIFFSTTNDNNNTSPACEIINDNISSSTSDLLILAEVAANRTELKH